MRLRIIWRVIKVILVGSASSRVRLHLKISRKLSKKSMLKRHIHNRLQKYGVHISPSCSLGDGLKLPHPIGIVIGSGVHLGENVTIFQNVTLGGARIGDFKDNNYPSIGKNVVIFAGAVIVGKINIGDGAVIGANAVVIDDVPKGVTCVGIPGKITQKS